MTHVIIHDNIIIRSSDAPFVDDEYGPSEAVDYDVVYVNGQLYKSGEEPVHPTTDILFEKLRSIRDTRLTATDKYLVSDYPITSDNLLAIKKYREMLRVLPEQQGAPWDGGGPKTPWPVMPNIKATK